MIHKSSTGSSYYVQIIAHRPPEKGDYYVGKDGRICKRLYHPISRHSKSFDIIQRNSKKDKKKCQ